MAKRTEPRARRPRQSTPPRARGGKPSPRGARATTRKRLAARVVAAIRKGKFIYVRAGSDHRFIAIWAVVVEGRVFARSWSLKPRSWYRTFLEDPSGAIRVEEREIPVTALRVRGEQLNDLIDRAYLEKYNSRGWLKYAQDLGRPKSRATTTEFVPL